MGIETRIEYDGLTLVHCMYYHDCYNVHRRATHKAVPVSCLWLETEITIRTTRSYECFTPYEKAVEHRFLEG